MPNYLVQVHAFACHTVQLFSLFQTPCSTSVLAIGISQCLLCNIISVTGIYHNTRYTQAHYASRSLLDVDMHCMEGRGLWSHANSCGVSL